MMPSHAPQESHLSNGGRLVSADAALPLRSMRVEVDACAGLARVVVVQRFHNPYDTPLAVTYAFPLPADGAVSAYAFTIGDRRIVGEVARRKEARERFEQAILEGKSAALLEQERSSLFTQEIGNVPPGAEVLAELTIDQPLAWHEDSWEWRFPLAAAPRYLGQAGRVEDAARVTVDVAEGGVAARATLGMRVRDALGTGRHPESPSHRIRSESREGACSIDLQEAAGALLDRDLVVRWGVAVPRVGLALDAGRPAAGAPHGHAAYGVLTVVPPSPEAHTRAIPRDVIVLLDTSGSMAGEPLDQARRVVAAVVDSLDARDRLEMIEFSSRARRWKPGSFLFGLLGDGEPVPATPEHKKDALAWLSSLRASGGTEMRDGIYEALRTLRAESQRQVILVTDGLIGFETEVVSAIAERLPSGSRLHTVGVGSAVNRSLLGPAARVGRGAPAIVGLGEDAERAARRIVARTQAPVVVDVEISGPALLEHAPRRLPDLFAGAPLSVGMKLRPEGGEIVVRGRTDDGTWEDRITAPATPPGTGNGAPAALFGRQAVEDLEMQLAAGGNRTDIDAAIERIGLELSLATRLTSWVAVSEQTTVDPREPTRRVRIPQQLPHGMSAEGLGLRSARPMSVAGPAPAMPMARAFTQGAPRAMRAYSAAARPAPPPQAAKPPVAERLEEEAEERTRAVATVPGRLELDVGTVTGRVGPSLEVRTLRGRVVRHVGEELVVELEIEGGDLEWAPADPVDVVFDDGSHHLASIVVQHTTRPGIVGPGVTLRLALQLVSKAAAGRPREVTLSTASAQLVIRLAS